MAEKKEAAKIEKKEVEKIEIQLLLVTGEYVNVEISEDVFDQVYEELYESLKNNDLWIVNNYPGVVAFYAGNRLTMLDMKKVIGFNQW